MHELYYSSLLYGGFVLGCLHALDADHIATVSSLIMDRRSLKDTVALALKWALGHSLMLLLLAGGLMLLRMGFANVSLTVMERVIGFSMVYLGGMLLFREWNRARNPKEYEVDTKSRAGWVLFGMGVLHGTAGWSSIFLLAPVTLFEAPVWVFAYIGLFSLGMIGMMGLYSLMVHRVMWIERLGAHLGKVRCMSATVTLLIGLRLLTEIP